MRRRDGTRPCAPGSQRNRNTIARKIKVHVMFNKLWNIVSRVLAARESGWRRKPERPRFVPAVDELQARLVPATLTNGTLYIFGTDAADVVTVTTSGANIRVVENGRVQTF